MNMTTGRYSFMHKIYLITDDVYFMLGFISSPDKIKNLHHRAITKKQTGIISALL